MKWLINELINPMTWLVIGLFFLWLFSKKLNGRIKKIGYWLLFLVFYLSTTPFIPQKLASSLERKFPILDLGGLSKDTCYNIIVLGGGLNYVPGAPANSQLSTASLMRLAEASRIYQATPCSKFITSGYAKEGPSLAELAGKAALSLGVSPGQLQLLPATRTTQDEANEYVKKFGKKTPLIIVTSALHMQRANFLFRQVGVANIRSAPTDFPPIPRRNPNSLKSLIPSFKNNYLLISCLHEIIGLWHVKITGYFSHG